VLLIVEYPRPRNGLGLTLRRPVSLRPSGLRGDRTLRSLLENRALRSLKKIGRCGPLEKRGERLNRSRKVTKLRLIKSLSYG